MLYVFWVERGTIITLHVDVAVDTVLNLKTVLTQQTGVSENNQVLLINGGESLQDAQLVAKYQSGTDTNPIFLFNRAAIEAEQVPDLPSSSTTYVPDENESKENVDAVLNLPNNVNSLVSRTQLAQELNRQCSLLVHEQQLQHQGWQAVMANLEDVISAFEKRLERFKQSFENYLETRSEKLQQLESFSEDLDILNKIELFKSVVRTRPKHAASVETALSSEEGTVPEITILDWISSKDPEHSLLAVSEGCRRTMEVFDESTLVDVMKESLAVVEFCNNPGRKEIKGLAERLFGLDQLLHESKKYVLDQKDTAEGIYKLQTQATATAPRDAGVLKDISAAYPQHFNQMLRLHFKLYDIKRRCLTAKQELCSHLHVRLKWVVAVENSIMEVDDKIKIYFENIKRIRRLTHMLQQVSTAPLVYISAAQEVIRRRRYSSEFLKWASSVANVASRVFNQEREARKQFIAEFGTHFLLSLFPGLEELPPPFALTPPDSFDITLPVITTEDVQILLEKVPELKDHFRSSLSNPLALPRIADYSPQQTTLHCEEELFLKIRPHLFETLSNIDCLKAAHRQLYLDIRGFFDAYLVWMRDLQNVHWPEFTGKLADMQSQLLSRSDEKEERYLTDLEILKRKNTEMFQETAKNEKTIADARLDIRRLNANLDEIRPLASNLYGRGQHLRRLIMTSREMLEENRSFFSLISDSIRQSMAQLSGLFEEALRLIFKLAEESTSLKSSVRRQSEECHIKLGEEKEMLRANLELQFRSEWEEKITSVRNELAKEMDQKLKMQANRLEIECTTRLENLRTLMESEKLQAMEKLKQELEESIVPHVQPKATRSGSALSEQLSEMEKSFSCRELVDMSESQMTSSTFVYSPTSSNPPDLRPGANHLELVSHHGCITLSSCNVGDLLLFVYNKEYRQYTAHLPFKKSLYLLHADSLTTLGLFLPEADDVPVQHWLIAEVVGKEYVLTKKIPNRYNLQTGTKFFRVQAKPWIVDSTIQIQTKGVFERRSDASIS